MLQAYMRSAYNRVRGVSGLRNQCRRHGQDYGPCSCGMGKMPRLIEPVLLYLLSDGQVHHGYELIDMARREALTDSEIDAGGVYRVLRRLEEAGCAESRWQPGEGGPRKRLYLITETGRRHLADWSTVIARCGQSMVEFARRCHLLKSDQAASEDRQTPKASVDALTER